MAEWFASARQNVEFANPEYLVFVLLAAAFFLLGMVIWVIKLSMRPIRTHGSSYPLIGHVKFWFLTVFVLATASLAAARPFFVYGGSSFKRGDVDVIAAVDGSSSMWVKDLGPSRLDVVVREILNLQGQDILRVGDRSGLYVFGGTTIRKVHLSTNAERLMDVAGKLKPPETLTGDAFPWDSDVASAFENIYQSVDNQDRFQAGEDEDDWKPVRRSDRLVLLFTDGDYYLADAEQAKRLDVALAEFQRRGLAVYPIGIGTRTGMPLTEVLRDYDPGRDYDASLAEELEGQHTRLNMDSLSYIAQRTGGKVFTIDSIGLSASTFIHDIVDSHRNISFQLIPSDDKQEVWQYVVMAGIFLFLIGVLFY